MRSPGARTWKIGECCSKFTPLLLSVFLHGPRPKCSIHSYRERICLGQQVGSVNGTWQSVRSKPILHLLPKCRWLTIRHCFPRIHKPGHRRTLWTLFSSNLHPRRHFVGPISSSHLSDLIVISSKGFTSMYWTTWASPRLRS